MLSVEENELISRTGPGTPMGNLMRQYWIPAMLSAELPAPDCNPVRVLLLCEELIGFRDTNGKVGLVANSCAHRGASLFFGRNEDCGLRCVYHGWKYDVTGKCVDMPNEPIESNFKDRIHLTAYPCQERGGLVWAYMGGRTTPPPLPDIEGNMGEGAQCVAEQQECNYLQILEGSIDTSHAPFLHSGSFKAEDQPKGSFAEFILRNRAPHHSVMDTEAGTAYGANRDAKPGQEVWRIAQFMLPFYTMNPGGLLGTPKGTAARVPMDDSHTISFDMSLGGSGRSHPVESNTSDWYGRFQADAKMSNDFFIDREVQRKNEGRNGWTGLIAQDQAMTTSMGPIYSRNQEHLGTSDSMIIRTRRRLIEAAKAFAATGFTPPGVDNPEFYRVRSGTVFLPKGADWIEATKDLRRAFVEHPALDRSGLGGDLG